MLPRKKIRNLRSSNCWKCIEIVNPIINVLFLYHFKYFTIPSGGGGVRAHPPAYGPAYTQEICQKVYRPTEKLRLQKK